ncbi:MAG: MarR family transcriptional regulator [Spirochaetales bacterium]|nr:MarR family transcriptional regulator [Spirochaetales bacterium]
MIWLLFLLDSIDISLTSNYITEMNKPRPPDAVISVMSKKLRSVYALIRSELEVRGLQALDISHGDLMFVLIHSGPQAMKELSRRIDRDKSTVTSLVDKLEGLGFVKRSDDPADRRASIIGLTQKGEELKHEFNKISRIALERFWHGIPQHERITFMEILSRISI